VSYLGPSHAACNRATTPPASSRKDAPRWSRRWFEDAPESTVVMGIRRGGRWEPLNAANSSVTGNGADFSGGGIENGGALTLADSK
jgi:hypothetical protein